MNNLYIYGTSLVFNVVSDKLFFIRWAATKRALAKLSTYLLIFKGAKIIDKYTLSAIALNFLVTELFISTFIPLFNAIFIALIVARALLAYF